MKSSLDPRVQRVVSDDQATVAFKEHDHFTTYQVFTQKKTGSQHEHVGIVHAPNPEMAMLFAKEQYARRGKIVGIWVVKTEDVFSTKHEDMDMFASANAPEKNTETLGVLWLKIK
jgi:ring-1,2-phenylacetyl-CoA epoxidase subunit PaaB